MDILRGILGLVVILGLAWAFSTKRSAIKLRLVLTGVVLQIFFAFLVLRWEYGRFLITKAGAGINKLLECSFAGSQFVFGAIGLPSSQAPHGFMFAFQVLPTIIFIAAFFAILYHFGVMQFIINIAAVIMRRLMNVSGVEWW